MVIKFTWEYTDVVFDVDSRSYIIKTKIKENEELEVIDREGCYLEV